MEESKYFRISDYMHMLNSNQWLFAWLKLDLAEGRRLQKALLDNPPSEDGPISPSITSLIRFADWLISNSSDLLMLAEKSPVTADGHRACLGMFVWTWREGFDRPYKFDIYAMTQTQFWDCDRLFVDHNKCYSSEKAALNARRK